MKMRRMTSAAMWCALALVGMSLVGCGGGAEPDTPSETMPFEASALTGVWLSERCEVGQGADGSNFYFQREFTLTATTWAIAFTIYGDDACSVRLTTAQVSGPYMLGAKAQGLEGTRLGDFSGSVKTVTGYEQGFADFLASSGCGPQVWDLGVAQDVSQTGCAPLGLDSVEECPVEFDLVKLEGDKLYFGDRSMGMCDASKRTSTLQTVAVVKQ